MTLADLAGFRNDVVPAKHYDYRGWRMFTGDMHCQGPVILQALSVLAGFDLAALATDEDAYLHLVTEAMKLGFSDREKFYCDPNFSDAAMEELLCDSHVAQLRAMVDPSAALPDLATMLPAASNTARRGKRRDTTNFTIIDSRGNAFSCSASDTIDGNPFTPRSRPSGSACTRQAPTADAFPRARAQPGGRSPRHGALVEGGDVIPQGILQASLNIVDRGMSPQQAVEAPRLTTLTFPDSFFPHFHDGGRLSVEARICAETREALAARGHRIHLWPDYEFDASGVAVSLDLKPPTGGRRVLGSGADPRRSH